jgi:hypothetical protein
MVLSSSLIYNKKYGIDYKNVGNEIHRFKSSKKGMPKERKFAYQKKEKISINFGSLIFRCFWYGFSIIGTIWLRMSKWAFARSNFLNYCGSFHFIREMLFSFERNSSEEIERPSPNPRKDKRRIGQK